MATEKTVDPSFGSRNVELEGEIGTLNAVFEPSEVIVDEVQVQAPKQSGIRMVEIRVNEDISEMSYVSAGRRETYTFEVGHRYKVPVYIAQELENLGKVWH